MSDFHITVCVGVEKEGKFLIVQRGETASFPGLWEFPAGRVEFGEQMEEAARRELKEETNLEATELKYMGGYNERFDSNKHVIVHFFKVKEFTGEVKLSEEHSDFKWVETEQLKKNAKSGKIQLGIDAFKFISKY